MTAPELFILNDRIRGTSQRYEEFETPIARGLLIKIFSAFNDMMEKGGIESTELFEIYITEEEAWLMRSRISPFDKDGYFGENVGCALTVKIQTALIALDTAKRGVQMQDLPTADQGDATYKEARGNAREPNPNDPEDEPGDKPGTAP